MKVLHTRAVQVQEQIERFIVNLALHVDVKPERYGLSLEC